MLHLKIVTPAGVVYEDMEVDSITLPTKAGIITIKDDHVPLVTVVTNGEINVTKEGSTIDLAVSKGVLEIKRDSVINILADTAERAEEIDIERAQEARKRAEEYMKSKDAIADVEFAMLQAKIEKELARINLARRYRRR